MKSFQRRQFNLLKFHKSAVLVALQLLPGGNLHYSAGMSQAAFHKPFQESALNLADLPQGRERLGRLIQQHIDAGIELVKSGSWDCARSWFRDESKALEAGYNLLTPTVTPLRQHLPRTLEALQQFSDLVALNSFVNSDKRILSVADADIDGLPAELQAPLQFELALLAAEEWLHVLQEIKGCSLSSRAAAIQSLLSGEPALRREIELADYFIDRGLPLNRLSATRWLERYDRDKWLDRLAGHCR